MIVHIADGGPVQSGSHVMPAKTSARWVLADVVAVAAKVGHVDPAHKRDLSVYDHDLLVVAVEGMLAGVGLAADPGTASQRLDRLRDLPTGRVKRRHRRARPDEYPHVDSLRRLRQQLPEDSWLVAADELELRRYVPACDVDELPSVLDRLCNRGECLRAIDQDLQSTSVPGRGIPRCPQPTVFGRKRVARTKPAQTPPMLGAHRSLDAVTDDRVDTRWQRGARIRHPLRSCPIWPHRNPWRTPENGPRSSGRCRRTNAVRRIDCYRLTQPVLARSLPILALVLAGCGTASTVSSTATNSLPQARPQAIEPTAGAQASVVVAGDPVGDPNAHAPSLAEVKNELRMELIAVRVTNSRYINPLPYVTHWGRTDQGVDASMPVGAPILAPCRVKILGVVPGWFAGQPLVYFELLDGPDAGRLQFVAEQITNLAPVGILQQGQPIARYAASGTNIEYGWATIGGVTLAKATTGYSEGQVTPAGLSIRAWLNSLGANAGTG